jgi:hypothetical protein
MKKIYLHIGSEKTGSTTLQRFLSVNRHRLGSDGYTYFCGENQICYSQGRYGHFPIVASFYTVTPDFISQAEHYENTRMLSSIRQELISESRHVILSCEHFSSRLTHVADLEKLARALRSHDVTVVFYMRPQSELLWSAYSTAVLNGRRTPLSSDKINADNSYLNYYTLLEVWASVFGPHNIMVRDYKKLKDGDICKDFMHLLGIDDLSHYERPRNRNKSMPSAQVEFVRRLNAYIPTYEEVGSDWHRVFVRLRKVLRYAWFMVRKKDEECSDDFIRGVDAVFAESNEKLSRFFINRT